MQWFDVAAWSGLTMSAFVLGVVAFTAPINFHQMQTVERLTAWLFVFALAFCVGAFLR